MSVFISHAHVDRGLAEGFKLLIERITAGSIPTWHSSDTRPKGGVDPGDWRKQIWEKIHSADTILVLLTLQSNTQPWLVWESGFAEGNEKRVIPVLFWISRDKIHSVFRDRQTYLGDDVDSVRDLCGRIIKIHSGNPPDSELAKSWTPFIEQYQETVKIIRGDTDERTLFHDHFHNADTAKKMEGEWVAQWTEIKDDGTEIPFESDTLRVWSDKTRLRLVGEGKKGKPYPMEGVVSSIGQVALSYWSEGDTAICGTALLKPVGAGVGSRLVGSWQGYTARDLVSELRFFRGRVILAKKIDDNDDTAAAFVKKTLAKKAEQW